MTSTKARHLLAKALRKAERNMERSIRRGCYDGPPPVSVLIVKDINGNTSPHAR